MGLEPLPGDFVATRESLHRVAELLVAPARKPENEIALTATPGGFGTPPFEFDGARVQVRVEGVELVVERDREVERAALTSLAGGAALLGGLLLDRVEDAGPLTLGPVAADRLADFFAFAADALARFREALPSADAPSLINLWPEHFDIAFEAGSEDLGLRANYGASPGDETHSEPYLYVGPWTARPEGELWNASGFAGALLSYAELVAADDPAELAIDFFSTRRTALVA
jgi:hypothetical protein